MKFILCILMGIVVGFSVSTAILSRYEYRSVGGMPIVRVDKWRGVPEIRRSGNWEELQGKPKAVKAEEFDPDAFLKDFPQQKSTK